MELLVCSLGFLGTKTEVLSLTSHVIVASTKTSKQTGSLNFVRITIGIRYSLKKKLLQQNRQKELAVCNQDTIH
jgi:hypothetical protein